MQHLHSATPCLATETRFSAGDTSEHATHRFKYLRAMGLQYHDLSDATVRARMEQEWSIEWAHLLDAYGPRECYGKQLSDAGWKAFGELMPKALLEHDDDWLAETMDHHSFWESHLWRRAKPVEYDRIDAIEKLCVGEFNIAYIRGLALTLLDEGEEQCIVYRAGGAAEQRGECTSWEESPVSLQQVVDGHRIRYHPAPGDRMAFSIPTGPHCHHSIRGIAA